jgi:TetR/AcrR family transcriptional repressor of nem operon
VCDYGVAPRYVRRKKYVMPRKTDKRIRLIEAAKVLMHQQGFNLTTLADIAQEADVPLGNVYYYFKTKEAIGEAVIEKRSSEYAEMLTRFDDNTNPRDRLISLIEFTSEQLELIARYGCPVGGLCQELGKQGGSLADQAAKLLHDVLRWAETQFKALGFSVEAAELHAHSLVASIQGIHLLTHTFKDPKLATRQFNAVRNWLERITSKVGTTALEASEAF